MANMTLGGMSPLERQMMTIQDDLVRVALLATRAEAYWAEHGDGRIPSIYTPEQHTAFADILTHTAMRLAQLQGMNIEGVA